MLEVIRPLLLIMFTLYISSIDLKFHRIPNISLLWLIIVLINPMNHLGLHVTLLALFLLWIIGLTSKVGMGDLKLLTVLLVLQGEILLRPISLIAFFFVTTLMIAFHCVMNKSLRGDIALAPAILIPFTVAYLTN